MRFQSILLFVTAATAAVVVPRHHNGKTKTKTKTQATSTATAAVAAGTAATSATTGSTTVLTEVNGVPGNECLTFRNNGTRTPRE